MSLCRRTPSVLCILCLSLTNYLGLVASLPPGSGLNTRAVVKRCYPSAESPTPQLLNSLLTVASAKGVLPEVLPKVQTIFPETFGSYPQGVSINTVSTSNYEIPNTNSWTTYSSPSSYLSPLDVPSKSLQMPELITEVTALPTQVESVAVLDQKYAPDTETVPVTQTPTATVELAEVYQTPITVQIPAMPQLSPFIAVGTPLPAFLPSQSIIQEMYAPNALPVIYSQPAEIATVSSVPVETSTWSFSTCDPENYSQQLPAVRINMPSPEPVPAMIPPSISAPSFPSSCDYTSFGMPPQYPIIVMEKSKSSLKSILPILLVSLLDGGFRNHGGECCGSQPSSYTPIPFPIPIPMNNPIINGCSQSSQGKKKGKVSSSGGEQN